MLRWIRWIPKLADTPPKPWACVPQDFTGDGRRRVFHGGIMGFAHGAPSGEESVTKVTDRVVREEVSLIRSLSINFVVIVLILFNITEAWGARWKYYGANENGWYFYETGSMTRPSENVVMVLVQSAYTEKGVSHWVREGGKEFQNLGYSLIWCELNCAERAIRHLQIVFYSKDKEVFHPIRNEEWQLFVPDSMSEVLCKEICE